MIGLKRGYFVHLKDEDTGIAVVATVTGNGTVCDLSVGIIKDVFV